ncbi:hypothetical protein [Rhodococcus koreensis]|uniref:Uncharacterized protein n=1 Tax=Rhodococcus koreensis TaxID=99653 RepID=A0A1H5EMJ5_9NOCA|nr:hypothetical protein [Rhodococcus koreensis]SED92315.1 hypothetical protein SAMN04490239_9283 [Rhodococcus koreensis]
MTNVTATDRHGHEWELLPMQEMVCARRVADDDTVLNAEDLIHNHGPLLLSAGQSGFGVGTRDALLDVIDLVVSDPETASVDQVREVATIAQCMLTARPAPKPVHREQTPTFSAAPRRQSSQSRNGLGRPW